MIRAITAGPLLVLGGVLLSTFALSSAPAPAPQGKEEIAYQARLLDNLGTPVNDPALQVTFNIYEFAATGVPIYTETDTVTVVDGLVSTYIGPLPAGFLDTAADLWLGVTYGVDAEMTPRMLLGSVPYALKAKEPTLPPGTIMMTGAAAAPAGFLLCDGSEVLRSVYFDLYAAIGTTYGAGNGSTTFNLPDLRGRFALGESVSGTGSILGEAGGAIDHAHTSPSHTHGMQSHTHSMQSHTHGMQGHTHSMQNHTHSLQNHTHSVPAHFHGKGSLSVGSSGAHDHLMPSRVNSGMTGGTQPHFGNLSAVSNANTTIPSTNSNHSHPSSSISGSVGNTGGSNGDGTMTSGGPSSSSTGAPSSSSTGAPSSSSTAGPSTTSTGSPSNDTTTSGGDAATTSENPPYQVVNYMIKY